jgi:hypothetical protein
MSDGFTTMKFDAIAVGMAGRFPDASHIAQFWRNLAGGLVTGMGVERGRRTRYHEPWFSFRIAAIAFRPRSFSKPSGFISASR